MHIRGDLDVLSLLDNLCYTQESTFFVDSTWLVYGPWHIALGIQYIQSHILFSGMRLLSGLVINKNNPSKIVLAIRVWLLLSVIQKECHKYYY